MDDQRTNRASGGVRYRKLRLAFSATCLIACVLLSVLWVRSYWRNERFGVLMSDNRAINLQSASGRVNFNGCTSPRAKLMIPPGLRSDPVIDDTPAVRNFDFGSVTGNPPFTLYWFWVPHWFLLTIAAALTAVPWLTFKRFSLRTLLIVTTLVAVVLGLAVL